jgi:iron complex transport system permease protein
MQNNFNFKVFFLNLLFLFLLLIAAIICCLKTGSADISFFDLYSTLFGQVDDIKRSIILNLRLPRIFIAIAVGGGLSIVGAIFQGIFMNPLAEPYVLGISSGAALGTVVGIVLGFNLFFINLFAFTGALVVTLFTFVLAHKLLTLQNESMLLIGIMISSFLSAMILIIISMAHETAKNAYFWLIGNLALADMQYADYVLIFTIIISIFLSFYGYKLNLLALGEDNAKYLGINYLQVKYILIILSSIMVAVLVSLSGIIGFVGLVVPHFTRLIYGVDNRKVLPYSFLIGAIYLTVADTIGRTVMAPAEIPVGAITAFLGSPIFIYFLRKSRIS